MAAYLVVDSDWKGTDLETRTRFGRAAQPVIAKYQGKFLTPTGGDGETLEGDWTPQVLTIVEFPDLDTVRTMMASIEFQAAAAIRKATDAVFKIVLVDGIKT